MGNLINKITELNHTISEFSKETAVFFKAVGKVFFYLTHPANLGMLIWGGAVSYSFYICLTITMLGLILYLIGVKKGAKYSKIAFFAYLIIQIFDSVSR